MYILNRDSAARLTISSPLEAHKTHTLLYHTVGVDVGFENPMFACLELDYEVCRAQISCCRERRLLLLEVLHPCRKLIMTPQERLHRWHSRLAACDLQNSLVIDLSGSFFSRC